MARIVIADDESLIRMDLAEILASAGHEVVGQAADGDTAIALIEQLAPDLAILDVKMPKRDGTEVAAAVRNHTAVVLLTAFAQREIVSQAVAAGVLGYLVKPFAEHDVLAAVEVALGRRADWAVLQKEIVALSENLELRKLLDRAKGLLQTKLALSEPEAFRWLQKTAMDRRLSVREVAENVLSELGPSK